MLRVCGVNRALEGLAIDVFNSMKEFGNESDDPILEFCEDWMLADEVTHVKMGSDWLRRLTDKDPDRRVRRGLSSSALSTRSSTSAASTAKTKRTRSSSPVASVSSQASPTRRTTRSPSWPASRRSKREMAEMATAALDSSGSGSGTGT